MTHYYVGSVVVTTENPGYYQIMEEKDGKQVGIAICPFNSRCNPKHSGKTQAMLDARKIVRALNLLEQNGGG